MSPTAAVAGRRRRRKEQSTAEKKDETKSPLSSALIFRLPDCDFSLLSPHPMPILSRIFVFVLLATSFRTSSAARPQGKWNGGRTLTDMAGKGGDHQQHTGFGRTGAGRGGASASAKPCPPPDLSTSGGANGTVLQVPAYHFSESLYRDVEEVRFVSYQGKLADDVPGRDDQLKVCKIRCEQGRWLGPICAALAENTPDSDPLLNGCEVPEEPSNVLYSYNNQPLKKYFDSLIPEGDWIVARCQIVGAFQFIGSHVLNCSRGKWIGEFPQCISTNTILNFSGPAPPTIQYHIPTGTWAVGPDGSLWLYPDTNAHLDCVYHRVNGTPTWTWNNTGIARLKAVEVVKEFQLPKEYPPPNYPRGWAMSPRERHWKYRLSFFYPKEEDSGVFICTTPEGYSNSIEVNIAPVHCGALNPLDPQLEIHQEDDKMTAVANFSCPLGYILHGDSSVMCLANGNWSGTVPSCKPVQCPPLVMRNLEPLEVVHYNDSYQGYVSFHCPLGYRLRGAIEIQCLQDGSWSAPPPTCQEIECPPPLPPLNGKVEEFRRYKVGAMVKYSCDSNLVIMGQPILICQADGTWSAPPPYCTIGCPYPEISLSNGQFSPIKFFYHPGDSVLVTCDPGFALSDERRDKLICNAVGKWFGNTGECLLVPTEPGPVYYYDEYEEDEQDDNDDDTGNKL